MQAGHVASGTRSAPDFILSALTWISGRAREFSPYDSAGTLRPDRLKAIAELSIALYCYVRLTGDKESRPVRRIITHLARVQRNQVFRELPLRFPDEFVPVCDVYAALRLAGHDSPEQRMLLQRVIDSGILEHVDRLPQGHMEVRLSAESAGLQSSWSRPAPHHALAPIPASILFDDGMAYALTHTIMFLTDFGAHPKRLRADGPLSDRLAMLLIRYCREQNNDLLAELLLCWDSVGLPSTPLTDAAWSILMKAQDRWGAFPVRGTGVGRDSRHGGLPRPSRFQRHYHTTLVAIIAGSVHTWRPVPGRVYPVTSHHRLPALAVTKVSRRDMVNAFTQSLGWLVELAHTRYADNPVALCYAALATWIGRSSLMSPSTSRGHDQVFVELAKSDRSGSSLVRAAVPATLKILVAAILDAYGHSLPSLAKFVADVVRVLRNAAGRPMIDDLYLHEKRLVLYAIGLHQRPRLMMGYEAMIDFAKRAGPGADDTMVDALLLRIECLTEHGTRRVDLLKRDLWLQELLAGIAQHALGKYDWERGCRTLRALGYLGLTFGASYKACISYMILHQTTTGAFAYLGREGQLFEARSAGLPFDVAVRIPVTIECLWTLAEVSSNPVWRLYGALPKVTSRSLEAQPVRE
jgi:uncharacterized protein DUF6895